MIAHNTNAHSVLVIGPICYSSTCCPDLAGGVADGTCCCVPLDAGLSWGPSGLILELHTIMQHHQEGANDRIGSAMSATEYAHLSARAKASPMFVLPLVKPGHGFHTLLLQCQLPHVLFTTLEEYKHVGVGAPPHFTITHYTELADSHGLVLTRGDVINSNVLNVAEVRDSSST